MVLGAVGLVVGHPLDTVKVSFLDSKKSKKKSKKKKDDLVI